MHNLNHPHRPLAMLATRQHGVVTSRQLVDLGLGRGAIAARIRSGQLHAIHRGVYAVGHTALSKRGHWLAAVLAHGDGAVLSHRSAATLWGILKCPLFPVEVTSLEGRRGRRGIRLHRATVSAEEAKRRYGIPVTSVARSLLDRTSVARSLLDLAEVERPLRLRRAFEEADRLNLLSPSEVAHTLDRATGRRGQRRLRELLAETRTGATRSPLEDRFLTFCRAHRLPAPQTNAPLLGLEVDALWPDARLVVELDGFAFHGHRAAFESDRARDGALQAAGYRVVRLTYRRLEEDSATVAAQLRAMLDAG